MSAVAEVLERASSEDDLLTFEEIADRSLDQRVELVEGRARFIDYFAVGTDEVWVISPKNRSLTIYTSPDASHTLFAGREATVTSARLPGFVLPLDAMAAKLDQIEAATGA